MPLQTIFSNIFMLQQKHFFMKIGVKFLHRGKVGKSEEK